MALPAFAAKPEARPDRDSRAEASSKAKDEKAGDRSNGAAKSSSASSSKASSQGQGASADKSSNASAQGQSASAGKSSNASAQGQSASAGKSSNASANSKGRSSSAPNAANANSDRGQKPAKAGKQDKAKAEENSPAGNKGSMKVRPVGTAAHPPRNYAHLPCVVQVDFYGSPHSGATLTALSHAPTAPTGQTLLTQTMTFSQSSPNPPGNELVGTTTLDFASAVSGLSYHPQQGYHVKLTAVQDGPQGGDVKHKVFWVDCAAPVTEDTAEESAQSEADTENTTDEVHGLSGSQDDTEVAGVTLERSESLANVGDRALGASAALGTRNSAALAATGIGALVLALVGLFALGGGAGMVRRFRRR